MTFSDTPFKKMPHLSSTNNLIMQLPTRLVSVEIWHSVLQIVALQHQHVQVV